MRTLPRRVAADPRGTGPEKSSARAEVAPVVAAPQVQWPGSPLLDAPETARVLHSTWSGDPAVVVRSPPGAGKTRLVVLLATALGHRADLRVGVAAQTRAQAIQIAERLGAVSDRARLLWATNDQKNRPTIEGVPVVFGAKETFSPDHGGCVVATTARWLSGDPAKLGCDVLIVDEAWQATYADLGALGAFSGSVVCVGDPGQIDPVVTGRTGRWRRSPTGPHLPAPDALRAAHGYAIETVALRHTWRLGPETTALIQPVFYSDLPFTSKRPDEKVIDPSGVSVPEVAHRLVPVTGGIGDAGLADAAVDRVRALLGATLRTAAGDRDLVGGDVAVVCPHTQQVGSIRALLADEPDVLVGTANQMQGLERAAVVALHPLAGYRDLTEFALDKGRACVTLSRHRAHLTVVMDSQTPDVLRRSDDVDGVTRHRLLCEALAGSPAM
ncbi:AAA family ATPase [Kribbella sp. NPDC059898]|uniref:AAA family ATPase n=1 Tax=Kribbella sp. NPDC059898 TaxID=3346995 RepID=UPI003667096F